MTGNVGLVAIAGGEAMGAKSRTKGASGERELARLLADELGPVARNLVQVRDGGHDLDGPGLSGWALEVKRRARVTHGMVVAWWDQAVAQALDAGRRPALAYREDRSEWRVVVTLGDLYRLYDLSADGGTWVTYDWSVTLSVPAFCALVREGIPLGGSNANPA